MLEYLQFPKSYRFSTFTELFPYFQVYYNRKVVHTQQNNLLAKMWNPFPHIEHLFDYGPEVLGAHWHFKDHQI